MRTLHMLHSLDIAPGDFGSTVRLGDKWANALNEHIELCVCVPNCHVAGHGRVIEVYQCKFIDVPARLIQFEHELESRLYSGLYDSMKRAYDDKFDHMSDVTVLVYKRLN